jgi:hypothetical protein
MILDLRVGLLASLTPTFDEHGGGDMAHFLVPTAKKAFRYRVLTRGAPLLMRVLTDSVNENSARRRP